jgi:hypothetical protein
MFTMNCLLSRGCGNRVRRAGVEGVGWTGCARVNFIWNYQKELLKMSLRV